MWDSPCSCGSVSSICSNRRSEDAEVLMLNCGYRGDDHQLGDAVLLHLHPQTVLADLPSMQQMRLTAQVCRQALERRARACLLHGLLCKGLPVAHAHIHLGILAHALQGSLQGVCLLLRDPAQRRAAPDLPVALRALASSEGRDQPSQRLLQKACCRHSCCSEAACTRKKTAEPEDVCEHLVRAGE